MSASEDGAVTVETEDVTVRKSINADQFETLAVVFDIRSSRESPVGISIVDPIPGSVPIEDVGFHPEYGGEHWEAGEEWVAFERSFDTGEQYTTVYGVRDFDGEEADLLSEPRIELVTAEDAGSVEGIEDLVSAEDSQVVREVISGERETLPGLEGETADAAESSEAAEAARAGQDAEAEAASGIADMMADAEAAEEDSPAEPGAAAEAGGTEADVDERVEPGEPADEEPPSATAGLDRSPAEGAADAEEDQADVEADDAAEPAEAASEDSPIATPEASDVPPEAEEPAAEAAEPVDEMEEPADDEAIASLGADGEPAEETAAGDAAEPAGAAEPESGAAEERAVAEVEAAEADESVTVPARGGVARVLAKELRAGNVAHEDRRLLRDELLPEEGSTDARIQRLQNQVADLAAYTEALEAFLDEEGGAEAVMGDLEARIDGLAQDVREVESTAERVDGALAGIEDRVEELSGAIEDLDADIEAVEVAVGENADALDGLAEDVDRVEADLGDRLGGVEDEIADIHDELEELATFRDRLSSVFGEGGEMGGGEE